MMSEMGRSQRYFMVLHLKLSRYLVGAFQSTRKRASRAALGRGVVEVATKFLMLEVRRAKTASKFVSTFVMVSEMVMSESSVPT